MMDDAAVGQTSRDGFRKYLANFSFRFIGIHSAPLQPHHPMITASLEKKESASLGERVIVIYFRRHEIV